MASKLIENKNLKNAFLVVDRESRRFKLDKEFKGVMTAYREKIDIADFDLARFIQEQFPTTPHEIIGIAKHLCGCATDLALTSLSL